jgi:hypothetical protein
MDGTLLSHSSVSFTKSMIAALMVCHGRRANSGL